MSIQKDPAILHQTTDGYAWYRGTVRVSEIKGCYYRAIQLRPERSIMPNGYRFPWIAAHDTTDVQLEEPDNDD